MRKKINHSLTVSAVENVRVQDVPLYAPNWFLSSFTPTDQCFSRFQSLNQHFFVLLS